MPDNDDTHAERPKRLRQKWGWLAWQAVVGEIAERHNPDATLSLHIYPMPHIIGWGTTLQWGGRREETHEHISFPAAFDALWGLLTQHHMQMTHSLDVPEPIGYSDDAWLDDKTNEAFSRLVHVTDTVFQGEWRILIIYRPSEVPLQRVQARLIADDTRVIRAGSGATLRDASRQLYHNAAPMYKQYSDHNN